MTVKMTVVNKGEFERKNKLRDVNTRKNLIRAVRVAATETRNTAVKSILQNRRSGGETTRYNLSLIHI